jgi:hypothetical protein
MLKVSFNANACDKNTKRIMEQIYEPLSQIANALFDDYGGPMENLWIDVELVPYYAERRKPWPFRLQKRVSGSCQLTGIKHPDEYNVGHYSVSPDFPLLLSLPHDQLVPYILGLLLNSFDSLKEKKSLKGFDVEAFKR